LTQAVDCPDQAKASRDDIDEIAVILPVYMCKSLLREVCDRLAATLSRITDRYSIVLVDDASPDHSWPLIEEMGHADPRIRGLRLCRNFGQHYALTAGLDHCRARWYVVMDCDLQDAPEDVLRLYEKAVEGHDVVVAVHGKGGHSTMKRLTSRLFYWLFRKLSGLKGDWHQGNFRIFSDTVAQAFRQVREQLRFLPATFDWMGFETTAIEVDHVPRNDGSSSYTFRKLAQLALNTILAHSEVPLKLVAAFGLVLSFASILGGAYIAVRTLFYGAAVSGWASLFVLICIIGGVQIFIMGVLGMYVGKTFNEAKKRPLYLVSNYSNIDAAGAARS
jgi:dolichol-phosphate mannosyltransferase